MRFFQSRASRLRDQLNRRQAEIDEMQAREAEELRTRESIDAKNQELNHLRNLEAEKMLTSDAEPLSASEQRELQTRNVLNENDSNVLRTRNEFIENDSNVLQTRNEFIENDANISQSRNEFIDSDANVIRAREEQNLQMRKDLCIRDDFDRSDFTGREEYDLLMRDQLRSAEFQTRHLDEIRNRGADNLRAREIESLKACGTAVPVVERRLDATPVEKTTYVVREHSSAGWAFAFIIILIAAGVGFMALTDLSSKQSRTESAMMELRQQLAEQRIEASDSSISQGLAPAVPGAQIPAPETNEFLSQDDVVQRSMQPSRNPAEADMPPPTGTEPTAPPARVYGPQPAPLAANPSQPVY